MSKNNFYYQTRSCKMQAKNNPHYLLESPSCAWARRRRILEERKFELRDPVSNSVIQTLTHNAPKQKRKQKMSCIASFPCNTLNNTLLSSFLLFFLIISSHCQLYHETKYNAHPEQQQEHSLSPLEGK